ncbi:MAG: DNA polymerase III subunit gamma/tau [Lachnospiraceae bacterium]
MSYMALYRKWRPDEFDEVKGQEHIVTTLKNQIVHNRIGHAYLFCGTRGTGKTTVAKLLAKAVNCEHPKEDGSPCGECPTCKAISSGSSLNVIEIDAASNNGVDNIREIRDEVQYSPTSGKYKVYIIDEVHMLSTSAFNALLKTLEEPPSYVIFILATTEFHKVPITVVSRCQRYDFRRISIDTIYDRLMDLLNREGIEAEEKAVRYVAKAADGSMRDALSLMDQCISFYLGQKLTYDNVLEVLGAVDMDVFHRLMQAMNKNQTMDALNIIDEIVWQGRELSQFVVDFTWYMRNLLLLKASDGISDQLDLSKENIEAMKVIGSQTDMNFLIRCIRIFSELSNQIRYATQKRVTLEIAVIKMTTPQMELDPTSLLERIRMLEEKIDEISNIDLTGLTTNVGSSATVSENVEETIDREEVLKKNLTPAEYEDLGKIVTYLKNLQQDEGALNRLGMGTIKLLQGAMIHVGRDKKSIMIAFENTDYGDMDYSKCSKPEVVAGIKDLIAQEMGKTVDINVVSRKAMKEEDLESINLAKVNFNHIKVEK